MSNWSHGYNVSLGYTYGFYRETSPAWLNFAAGLAGVHAPDETSFRYLELGCGQGLGLTLLASLYPEAEFLGVDFNPVHIAHARGLADAAGLQNVRFEEADFLQLAQVWPAEYGLFDYGVLHGILSWVSEDLRRALAGCLKNGVRAGGLVYASYNTMPGWLSTLPLQHLLTSHQKAKGLSPVPAIEQGLAFMEQLQRANAVLFKIAPQLASRLKTSTTQDKAYLVQEYLHDNWKCFWFSETVADLAVAKLEFVGTATLAEVFLPSMLAEDQRKLVAEQTDPIFRQELLDVCVNQGFRRDLFQRGVNPVWRLRQQEELLKVRFILLQPHKTDDFKFSTAAGELTGNPEIYASLLEALAGGSQSLADLKALPLFTDKSLSMLLQAVTMLIHSNLIGIAASKSALETAVQFNRSVARAAAEGAPYSCIACAAIANGIAVHPTELLLLDCVARGGALHVQELTEALLGQLKSLNLQLIKNGERLNSEEALIDEAKRLAVVFIQETLPLWKRLGAWQ